MTKAREIAELGQKLTVDGSGNLDIAGTVETDGALKVGSGSTLFGAADSGLNHFSNNYMYLAGGSNGTIIKSKGLATEYAKFEGGAITFNEDSNDMDFRVESDSNNYALFLDAGTGRFVIGDSAASYDLSVRKTNAGGDVGLSVENRDETQTTGSRALLALTADVDNDGTLEQFLHIRGGNNTSGFAEYVTRLGASMRFQGDAGTSAVFNDSGVDMDFRVETNSDTHALFVRGDTNFVSVGAGTGGFAKLHVADVPSSEYRTFMVSDPNDISKGIVMAYDLTNDRGVMHALDAGTGWKNIALAAQGGSVSIGMPVTGTIDAPLHVEGGPVMTGGWIRSQMLEGNFPTLVFHSTYGTDSYGGIGYDSTNENLDFWVGATSHDISSGSQKVLRLRDTDGFIWNDNSKSHLDFRVESDNNSGMLVVDASQDAVTIGSHRFAQTPQSAYNEFVHFNTGSTLVNSNSSTTVNLFNRGGTNVACCGTVYVACENSGANVHWGYIIDFFHSNGTLFTNARATGNSQGTTTCSVQTNGSSISVTVTYSSGLGGNIRYNAGGHASVCNY